MCLSLPSPQTGNLTSVLLISAGVMQGEKNHPHPAPCHAYTYNILSYFLHKVFLPDNIPWKSFHNQYLQRFLIHFPFVNSPVLHCMENIPKILYSCHKHKPFLLYNLLSPLIWETMLSFLFSAKLRNFKPMQIHVQ